MPEIELTEPGATAAPAAGAGKGLGPALQELHRVAAQLLLSHENDPLWPDRIRALAQRLGALQDQAPDAVLYLLLRGAARTMDRYSSHHALVCAAIARECAAPLGLSGGETHSLTLAALTMNVSITALQDELVYRERTPTLAHRIAIDEHSPRSAGLLSAAGVVDELWLGAVSQHHVEFTRSQLEDGLSAVQRLAHVLRRIDVLTAKMSPRQARSALPAPVAVRDAYLSPYGTPDDVGVALTKAIGIYPPGSLVTLDNGDTAIVLQRGARPSRPVVASLMGADRATFAAPVVRDTGGDGPRVKGAASAHELRMQPSQDELLLALAADMTPRLTGLAMPGTRPDAG